uniref:(northern house mosquito) hypothetical protein n=1 Tax=Culex pipiens TaxID=7175 RepID=A0A8D8G576_CULPI
MAGSISDPGCSGSCCSCLTGRNPGNNRRPPPKRGKNATLRLRSLGVKVTATKAIQRTAHNKEVVKEQLEPEVTVEAAQAKRCHGQAKADATELIEKVASLPAKKSNPSNDVA